MVVDEEQSAPSSSTGLYLVDLQERLLGFLSFPVLASEKRYWVPRAGLELRSGFSISTSSVWLGLRQRFGEKAA